jgi:hypothetical protein
MLRNIRGLSVHADTVPHPAAKVKDENPTD